MINVIVKDGNKEVGRLTFAPFLERGLSGRSWVEWEATAIAVTLIDCNDSKAGAAKILKISERTMYRKVEKYKLQHLCRPGDNPDPFGNKRNQRK